jgi:leader peptidase (prepilin peptidase)/N-methyltransferase
VTVLVLAGAFAGLAWGLVSDRISARWPAHEAGAVRPIDWRTPAVAAFGAVAVALLVARFVEPSSAAALGASVAGGPTFGARVVMVVIVPALVLLFATDLDQRLLPDVLTLPIGPIALLAFVAGANPYLHEPGELALAVAAAVLLPLGMFALSIPFGRGAIGMGDLKLLFGIGLLGGAWRLLAALVVGAIAAGVAIVVLIAVRRITLRSYVPYGPFLILGVLWALLVLPLDAPM